MNFIIFILLFLVLDIVLNILSARLLKMLGIDFLFFASWLAGVNYGIGAGITISVILLVEHTLIHIRKGKYIAFSLPAQIGAVLLGFFLGIGGFWVSLIVYQVINTLLMLIVGGMGPFFLSFLAINTTFNIILYNIWLWIG